MNGGAPLKGETKFFFQEKTIDMLLSMIMALGSEISALSEKLDTVIDILADRDIADVAYIETFEPGPEQQARRDAARKRLVATLLAAYQDEADTLASPES